MADTAIRAAMSAYSIRSCPDSFANRLLVSRVTALAVHSPRTRSFPLVLVLNP